jgi:hypothetical protein
MTQRLATRCWLIRPSHRSSQRTGPRWRLPRRQATPLLGPRACRQVQRVHQARNTTLIQLESIDTGRRLLGFLTARGPQGAGQLIGQCPIGSRRVREDRSPGHWDGRQPIGSPARPGGLDHKEPPEIDRVWQDPRTPLRLVQHPTPEPRNGSELPALPWRPPLSELWEQS